MLSPRFLSVNGMSLCPRMTSASCVSSIPLCCVCAETATVPTTSPWSFRSSFISTIRSKCTVICTARSFSTKPLRLPQPACIRTTLAFQVSTARSPVFSKKKASSRAPWVAALTSLRGRIRKPANMSQSAAAISVL